MTRRRSGMFSTEEEEDESGAVLPVRRRSIRHSRIRLPSENSVPRDDEPMEEEEEEEEEEEFEAPIPKSPPFFRKKSTRISCLARSHMRRFRLKKEAEEHEQIEFKRQYSSDLRSRRRHSSYKASEPVVVSPRRGSQRRHRLDASETETSPPIQAAAAPRYSHRTRHQKTLSESVVELKAPKDEDEDIEEVEDNNTTAGSEKSPSPKRQRRRREASSGKAAGEVLYNGGGVSKEEEDVLNNGVVEDDDEEKENSSYLDNRGDTAPGGGGTSIHHLRRSTRSRRSNQKYDVSEGSDPEEHHEEESSRTRVSKVKRTKKKKSSSSSKKVLRSSRHQEGEEDEGDVDEEDDEDDEETEYEETVHAVKVVSKEVKSSPVHKRPQRSRIPVNRLTYTNFRVQYSSEDELKEDTRAANSSNRHRKKYNMRENRRTTTRYTSKNTSKSRSTRRSSRVSGHKKKISYGSDSDNSSSSSSSSPSADESRFEKRKAKRMIIEKSKMMPLNLKKKDLEMAFIKDRQKVGSSMADVSPMDLDLSISFDSVRGIEEHINSLKEMVIFPLLYPELFSKYEITPPRGVLFYGPPGTGKTLVARALASEISKEGKKVAFFMRKGADCLSKWIGESERQLRLLFDQAYLMRPSIIFFDEIDGLAPIRSSRQDQIHSSIVSTLLALMDGLDNRGEIIVIGATNRIDSIDPALRRPGRFDRELRFSLPTRKARKEILELHVGKWEPRIKEDALESLADRTIGYCGADLKGLCGEAALIALRRRYPQVYKTMEKLRVDFETIHVLQEDFEKAMRSVVPSSHRIADQFQSPLPPHVRPLLNTIYGKICTDIDRVFPMEGAFRPRMLLCAEGSGHGQTTYLGPAILHHLERLPAQKLDIPALFSNSARSPEEALSQIIREAKRALPGVLYIPHISKLWSTVSDTVQKTFLSMMGDVPPSAQLLLLAISDAPYSDLPEELRDLFLLSHREVFTLETSGEKERAEFFQPVFSKAMAPVALVLPEEEAVEEDNLPVVTQSLAKKRMLTEKEEKKLRKKEEHRLRELRIFLRDVHQKITREQKFFMFRSPVDLEEVYDYLDFIKKPMDFDAMLLKLDKEEYTCAKDYLDDIDLIVENAIVYNSDSNYETNKIICHQAAALRDFSYALVKQEMDTDFEEECQEISERRKKLLEDLKELEGSNNNNNNGDNESTSSQQQQQQPKSSDSQHPHHTSGGHSKRRTTSRWSRGELTKKKKKLSSVSLEEEELLGEEEDKALGPGISSTTSPAGGGGPSSTSPHPPPPSQNSPADDLITTGIRIDALKLQERKNELIKITKGFSLERLERVLSKVMNVVDSYATESDRTQLPSDLSLQFDIIKSQRSNHNR